MPQIDPIFLTTTIIKRFNEAQLCGVATGFFFSRGDDTYLVTNKHVIYGEEYYKDDVNPEIDEIRLILHVNKDNVSQNEETVIKLFKDDKKIWKEHPQKNIDIVCIPVSLDRQRFLFLTIDESSLDSENLKVSFEKLFMMGYPHGWYDTFNNLPITRIGHLSSPFGVAFGGNPFMLGDIETHPGMSGSPVFMYLKDYISIGEDGGLITNIGATKTILIGVFSGQPKWEVKNKEGEIIAIPHSLSIIWFSGLIKEILSA